ncbi:thiamine pyrophosphate-dependent enzyme [Spirochaetota bacterium]
MASQKLFLSGNEAVAKACVDFGCDFASGYPGTPSTEILESLSAYRSVNCSWAPNEKVALELCIGASFAGARSLATMKHVGLNVASDPFMTLSYTGVKGGLVVVSCDDPSLHSSQNEQDNRHYAQFAKVPMLEPSSSGEVYHFLKHAFSISERYDTPVLFRMTTRISHSKGIVHTDKPIKINKLFNFDLDDQKYVMIPSYARKRHIFVEKRLCKLQSLSEKIPINIFEKGKGNTLIVCSSVSYQYVKEACPDAPVFKLGMSYPLPIAKIKRTAQRFKKILCIEELDPFIEMHLLYHGVSRIVKRNPSFYIGELNPDRVRSMIMRNQDYAPKKPPKHAAPPKPPALCKGCPHIFMFELFKKYRLNVSGDIGCYTLGTLPPYNSLHACIDMGASIPIGLGMREVLPVKKGKKVISVIGDSTFIHSGITGIVDAVYNNRKGIIVILNNNATAMTGCQDHPGTGITLLGKETHPLDFYELCKACGVRNVYTVDPYKKKETEEVLKAAIEKDELTAIVANRECILNANKRSVKT